MIHIMQRHMELADLQPAVLNIGYSEGAKKRDELTFMRTPERFAYDYEIELFLADGGMMWVDSQPYQIEKGDLVFRRPGQRCNSMPPYSCWFITIDPTGKSGKTIDDFDRTRQGSFQELIRNPIFDLVPAHMKVRNESAYIDCFSQISILARSSSETDRLKLRIQLLKLLSLMCQDADQSLGRAQDASKRAVMAVIKSMHADYASKLTLERLSSRAKLSPIYFHRLFKEITRTTPALYLQTVRLDRARYLLLHTSLTCNEIANQCGFTTASYFGMVFKKQTGMTPLEFRSGHYVKPKVL